LSLQQRLLETRTSTPLAVHSLLLQQRLGSCDGAPLLVSIVEALAALLLLLLLLHALQLCWKQCQRRAPQRWQPACHLPASAAGQVAAMIQLQLLSGGLRTPQLLLLLLLVLPLLLLPLLLLLLLLGIREQHRAPLNHCLC
jgi:hypothetical protein